jgi:aminoglycoside phosphotransferase (APT) family kinase protein
VGAPYVVTDYIAGEAIRAAADLDPLDDEMLDGLLRAVASALAELHSVDHVAVGLEKFGNPTGYAERQLTTWSRQWSHVGLPALVPLESEVQSALAARVPEQRRTSIVHGDYRLDNTMVSTEGAPHVLAVVDWELSTIGDPVADVALMGAYRHPAFDLIVGETSAWTSPRLPSAEGLAEMYVAAGGADLAGWRIHLALAHYKIAVIAAGIEHRRRAGSGSGPGFDTAALAVEPFLRAAHDLLAVTAEP